MAKTQEKSRFDDLASNDTLSSNREICWACKGCAFWGNSPDNYYTNLYDKAYCDIYDTETAGKPAEVIHRKAECPYRRPREDYEL